MSWMGWGGRAFLHTYLMVREDALNLVWLFERSSSGSLFELLLTVQGVGPRLALAVLSTLSLDVLRLAVAQEQPEVLDRVPGVGRKTAEKIVFALKDKLGAEVVPRRAGAGQRRRYRSDFGALTALGYSVVEAQAGLQSIPKGQGETSKTASAWRCSTFQRP